MTNKEFFKAGNKYKYIGENCHYFKKGHVYECQDNYLIDKWTHIQVDANTSLGQYKGKYINGFGEGYMQDYKSKELWMLFVPFIRKSNLPKWL